MRYYNMAKQDTSKDEVLANCDHLQKLKFSPEFCILSPVFCILFFIDYFVEARLSYMRISIRPCY